MAYKPIILLPLLLMSACSSGPKEPEWKNLCVESHTEFRMMPTSIYVNGRVTTTMTYQPVLVCDRQEWTCVIPEDSMDQECPVFDLTGEE